jgi:NTP pyrophosphatase (non-canonical NTP hydrolase)
MTNNKKQLNFKLTAAIAKLTNDSLKFNDISGSSDSFTHTSVEQQLRMILSEVGELVKAFKTEQPINVAAEAVDVIVTVIGLLQKLNNAGMDVSSVAGLIADKNLEKFPTVNQVSLVDRTISDYASKGITVVATSNNGHYAIKDTNGKCRKPLGFTPVDLSTVEKGQLKDCFPVIH